MHPSLYHISSSISIKNISMCLFVVAAYPGNPSHPGALTRCKPSCTDKQCGHAKHSRTMINDCDRSHSAMSRHNYMRKRNGQLYCSSMESQTVLLDSRRYTMVRQDALWWNWMSQAKMRASASLRQFWLSQKLSWIQLGGGNNRCTMAHGKAMVHHHLHWKLYDLRRSLDTYTLYRVCMCRWWRGEVPFPCEPEEKGNDVTRNQHV